MLPRQLTLPPHPPARLTPSPSYSCSLFALPKQSTPIKSIACSLFRKTPGWGGTSAFIRSLLFPPSHAPRSASIPSALSQLRILPVATGVYYPQHFHASSVAPRVSIFVAPLFSYSYELLFPQPLSFHNHPHCPGVWGSLRPLCSSVASVLSGFLQAGGEGSKLLVIRVNPFAGKVLWKRRNFIGELCERIEPGRRSRAGTV